MLRGTIRANHPSGQHAHGHAIFTKEARPFVVDEDAVACDFEKTEMVFTAAFYESLRAKIGEQLAVEPVVVDAAAETDSRIASIASALESAQAELAALRAKHESQISSFNASWTDVQRELAIVQEKSAQAQAQVAELQAQLAASQARVAELEESAASAAPASSKTQAPQ